MADWPKHQLEHAERVRIESGGHVWEMNGATFVACLEAGVWRGDFLNRLRGALHHRTEEDGSPPGSDNPQAVVGYIVLTKGLDGAWHDDWDAQLHPDLAHGADAVREAREDGGEEAILVGCYPIHENRVTGPNECDTSVGCPRGNEHCGYARGERYCSLWDTCQDLGEMSRQLEAIKAAQADEGIGQRKR